MLSRLLEIGALCSETQIEPGEDGEPTLNGAATENALVRLALDAGMDVAALRRERPRLSIRLRSESYRFMVTTHRQEETGRVLMAVKGSPEEVLDLCTLEMTPDGPRPLTPERRAATEHANASMAKAALRVLGFACREAEGAAPLPWQELTWVGLAGMADPVRPGPRR
jgi:Ca2+-transporting ATPase